MLIKSDTYTMSLEDTPLDIGYASEKVAVVDTTGSEHTLGGYNKKTQVLITLPTLDDASIEELNSIEELMGEITSNGAEHEVSASVVVANKSHNIPQFDKLNTYIDTNGELGDFYGVRLKGEPFNNELTKAIILISKDGAIYYDNFVSDLEDKFDLDTLYRKITAAQLCYTGKGCH